MKESKEKLNMRSGTAAVLIIATLLIAGSLIFIAAQPGEDLSDNEGTLGDAAPYVLQLSDIDTHSRTGNAIVIDSLSAAGKTNINAAGAVTLSGMVDGEIALYIEGIGVEAFKGTGITSIDLRSGLESDGMGLLHVGAGAFKDCIELQSVIVGDTVEDFGAGAFEGCVKLSMTLPVKGGPLDHVGSHLEMTFGTGCFNDAVFFDFDSNVSTFFKGLEYSEDGGSTWVPFEPFISTNWKPSDPSDAFKIRPVWEEGKMIKFKSGLSGVNDVEIMKIVGSEFTLSSAYQQACAGAKPSLPLNYFESNNLNRVIYYWANEDTGEKFAFGANFEMVDDVTFTVAPGDGWSIKPGGDESNKKDGPFGLDGPFFWLLVLLIIILLAILAAYMISKRRKQQD